MLCRFVRTAEREAREGHPAERLWSRRALVAKTFFITDARVSGIGRAQPAVQSFGATVSAL
jgi:hypothetical protein